MIFKVPSKMENKSDKVNIQEWMDQTLKDLTQRIENLKIDLGQSDENMPNFNEFHYEIIDFDDTQFKTGFSFIKDVINKEDLINFFINDEIYMHEAKVNGKEFDSQELNDVRTSELNPLKLHFDMDSQLKVIMDNLFDTPLIYNYKSALWLSEVCHSIKQIVYLNADTRIFQYGNLSDRLKFISNIYNFIERRVKLVLYAIFKHGFYSQFYEDEICQLNPIIINEENDDAIFADSYQLFSSNMAGDEINVDSYTFEEVEETFRNYIDRGYFTNVQKRAQIIEILSKRIFNVEDEVVYVNFDNQLHVIKKSESMTFKMFMSYIFLRDNRMYDVIILKINFDLEMLQLVIYCH